MLTGPSACVFKPQHNLPKPRGKVNTVIIFITTFPLLEQKNIKKKKVCKVKECCTVEAKSQGSKELLGLLSTRHQMNINTDWRGTSSRDVFHHRHSPEGPSRKTQQQILRKHSNNQPSWGGFSMMELRLLPHLLPAAEHGRRAQDQHSKRKEISPHLKAL